MIRAVSFAAILTNLWLAFHTRRRRAPMLCVAAALLLAATLAGTARKNSL
jgi:hypothetical protein